MRGKAIEEGKYVLFKTTKDHPILKLGDNFYALVEGQKGDIIVSSNSDHKKKKTIAKGGFYYVDFEDDPEFQDMPHLFLKDGNKYRELILPEGLPGKQDKQKKIIHTDEKLSENKVLQHIKGKGNKGNEKQYSDKSEGLRTKTKKELYNLSQKHEIKGRSKMDKDELVHALEEEMDN